MSQDVFRNTTWLEFSERERERETEESVKEIWEKEKMREIVTRLNDKFESPVVDDPPIMLAGRFIRSTHFLFVFESRSMILSEIPTFVSNESH